MKRKIYIILTIIWMITIFCFSARNGVTSTGDSHYIGMRRSVKFLCRDLTNGTVQDNLLLRKK